MEEKLNLVKASGAWSEQYNLPTFPVYDNPWIYMAYLLRILGWDEDRSKFPEWFLTSLSDYFRGSEVLSGYILRRPGGGTSSHDEVMGAAFISAEFAARAVSFLSLRDGLYSLPGRTNEIDDNWTRFVFLSPYLKAEAGENVSLWSQILFAGHVLNDCFTTPDGETSGPLKIWLMAPAMRKFAWTKLALSIWAWRWTARGWTPKRMFTEIYLKEYAFLGEWARADWT